MIRCLRFAPGDEKGRAETIAYLQIRIHWIYKLFKYPAPSVSYDEYSVLKFNPFQSPTLLPPDPRLFTQNLVGISLTENYKTKTTNLYTSIYILYYT